MNSPSNSNDERVLTAEILRQWPLPMPSDDGDKETRGRVLVIGGSREMPGTVLLAGNAALRAGAGKVAIATGVSIAALVAAAIPESRVIALPEMDDGSLDPAGVERLGNLLPKTDAVLIGPGMENERCVCELVRAALPRIGDARVILDAHAMNVVRPESMPEAVAVGKTSCFLGRFKAQVLLTPHAGEMAHLTGTDKKTIEANQADAAYRAALTWGAIVALKGGTTHIAAPDGRRWRHEGNNIGLAVSGSGDTLSGIIVGLAARGCMLDQACSWGVALHSLAAERLAAKFGPLGYLARELAAEVPMLMHDLRPL